jgi:uncharacterized protein (TIGR03790 family)
MKHLTIKYGLALATVLAQPPAIRADYRYREVAVIINSASPLSVAIGEYYASVRGIPASNIIRVNAPAREVITGSEFELLRGQIEASLLNAGIADSINFLVTTKGMPLKVDRGNSGKSFSNSASVESELACILSPLSMFIGGGGGCVSPYFDATVPFSRSRFGIYLVTRLDGYTTEDVLALIDRSGPNLPLNSSAIFVFDEDPHWPVQYSPLNNTLDSAGMMLRSRGRNVLLNRDSLFLTHQTNVAGYVSWGSNDHHASDFTTNAIPKNTWARGAIAETYVSTSARSFVFPPLYGQSLIADLIHEGASGAKGYVDEPFLSAMANVRVLFSRYTTGATLAESYYAASRYLSWMDVVIGDPLTGFSETETPLPVQLSSFRAAYHGSTGEIRLEWITLSETNNYGFMVQRRRNGAGADFTDLNGGFVPGGGTTLVQHAYACLDRADGSGTFDYRLKLLDRDGNATYSESQSVIVTVTTGAAGSSLQVQETWLEPNYPNPFNPSTSISYFMSEAGEVHLAVYDLVGREVATLVQGRQNAGRHTVVWNSSGNSAGVYVCRLRSGQKVWNLKMLSLK